MLAHLAPGLGNETDAGGACITPGLHRAGAALCPCAAAGGRRNGGHEAAMAPSGISRALAVRAAPP